MNTRRLATWVVLNGTAYGPHHDLTPEQAALITNPLAWADDPPPDPSDTGPASHEDPTPDGALGEAVDSTPRPADDPPPRAGRGSGIEAWQAFADAHKVDFPAGSDRAVIILACERAGLLGASTR